MEWNSPRGIGFPGWHIECSAMSAKYLGPYFDIHAGGEDHISVHHSNEIAQTQCGTRLANFWMHGYFLQVDTGLMGKSAGNFVRLQDVVDRGYDPLALSPDQPGGALQVAPGPSPGMRLMALPRPLNAFFERQCTGGEPGVVSEAWMTAFRSGRRRPEHDAWSRRGVGLGQERVDQCGQEGHLVAVRRGSGAWVGRLAARRGA